MSWDERRSLYKAIETHRKRPLIVYVTSERPGAVVSMASDVLPSVIEQLDDLPTGTKTIDLLIGSYGGDPMVAWRIMSLIRERKLKVSVLIPHSAYSAATLLALGANKIVIHPNGHLGPVDMQITTSGDDGQPRHFSTEDISAFLDFVRDNLKITDQEHIRMLFEITCKEVGSLGIGFTARSSKLAVDLGERLLRMHMDDDDSGVKLRSIVQNMSRKFQSHSYPVSRTEAVELGLQIDRRDETLEKLMWKAWQKIEKDLDQRTPFDAVAELAKSPQAASLFSPVPQMDIPAAAAMTPSYGVPLDDVVKHTTAKIDPVDFEFTAAVMESSRSGSIHRVRGKILACRMPDMTIRHHLVVTSRIWETQGSTP